MSLIVQVGLPVAKICFRRSRGVLLAHGILVKYLRASPLYSTVDGSRQGVFWIVGKKKIKNKKCLLAHVGGRKKIKGKLSEFQLFVGIFNMFLAKKYILVGNIYVMSEEKIKKKAEWSFFFLSGLISAHRRNCQP